MKKLRIQRAIRGFTQFDIFLKAGIPQSRISLIENGYILPKHEEKLKLAKVLKCQVADIFPENGGNKND